MADIDGDEDKDLLYGDDVGFVRIYMRDDEGNLSYSGYLNVDGEDFDIGDRAAPETVDWDLDGDLDLLLGSAAGTVTLLVNNGTPQEAEFTVAGTLEAGGGEIWLGSETAPAVGDLDGDRKRDLVLGSIFGELWFYANTGQNDAPQFADGVRLEDEEGPITLFNYSRPELADWEGDGDLDLISGLVQPEVRLYLNPTNDGVPDVPNPPPAEFVIISSYPEPFNRHTTIELRNLHIRPVRLNISALDGTLAKTMDAGFLPPGVHHIRLDMGGSPSGRYLVQLAGDGAASPRSITLIR